MTKYKRGHRTMSVDPTHIRPEKPKEDGMVLNHAQPSAASDVDWVMYDPELFPKTAQDWDEPR